jgi:hypothetical protein
MKTHCTILVTVTALAQLALLGCPPARAPGDDCLPSCDARRDECIAALPANAAPATRKACSDGRTACVNGCASDPSPDAPDTPDSPGTGVEPPSNDCSLACDARRDECIATLPANAAPAARKACNDARATCVKGCATR